MTQPQRTVLQLRCTAEEKARWKSSAKEAGLSLSDWIKVTLEGGGYPLPASGGSRVAPTSSAIEQLVAQAKPGPVSSLFAKRT